jgi:cell division protein FtsI (penicillin-binding protein 3)
MADPIVKIKKRTILLSSAFFIFWLIVLAKLFTIQVIHTSKYQQLCKDQADFQKIIPPIRGTIYDRNLKALTVDLVTYDLGVHPYLIKDKERYAQALSSLLKPNYSQYLNLLKSDKSFLYLERNIPHQEMEALLDKYQYFPGFAIERKIRRNYPFSEIAGPLIGVTNVDNRGIVGLELELEPYICGTPGWQIALKDGWGRLNNRPDLPFQETINGNDVVLTIDNEYQTILFEELHNAFERHHTDKAMGIIINPLNGEILAMVSLPAFNPNSPDSYPVSAQKNSVVTDIFEPGSTFKIITATAALDNNKVNPEDIIYCNKGEIEVGKRIIHDYKKYEYLTFAEVIEKSSNIGTIKIAQKIGADQVFDYARRYGFGAKTDIQFPGEVAGVIHPLKKWTELTLAQVAIGQGISCTALQLAYAYAAIANGGYLLKPQIVKRIETKEGICLFEVNPQYIRRVASPQIMTLMKDLLRLTVQSGTGIKADINGMAIAGKTGTAQKVTPEGYSKSEYNATFVGFFPVDNPQLLCAVILDNPKGYNHTGGSVAAPVVRDIFTRIVNLSDELFFPNDQPPTPPLNYARNSNSDQDIRKAIISSNRNRISLTTYQFSRLMPDLRGRTLRQAVAILQNLGVEVTVNGTGLVISQFPEKNSVITADTRCVLNLQPRGMILD